MGVVAVGTSEGKCTMMEGEAKCAKDTKFLECVRVGLEYCAEIAGQIDMVGRREGKRKVGGGTPPCTTGETRGLAVFMGKVRGPGYCILGGRKHFSRYK